MPSWYIRPKMGSSKMAVFGWIAYSRGYEHYGVKRGRRKEARYFTKKLNKNKSVYIDKNTAKTIKKLQDRGFDVEARFKPNASYIHNKKVRILSNAVSGAVAGGIVGSITKDPITAVSTGLGTAIGGTISMSRKPHIKYKVSDPKNYEDRIYKRSSRYKEVYDIYTDPKKYKKAIKSGRITSY